MKLETQLNRTEQQLLSLILPASLLDYFEIKSVRDIKIGYEVLLEDKADTPAEYRDASIRCRGFYPKQTILDFPLRGKVFDLIVKRRSWLNTNRKEVMSRDWGLVAKRMRFSQEFATFLKGYLDTHPISSQSLANHYGLDGQQLQEQYRNHLSDYHK